MTEAPLRIKNIYILKHCCGCQKPTEHYKSSGVCVKCKNDKQNALRAENPNAYRKEWRDWNKRNPDRRLEINRQWKEKQKQLLAGGAEGESTTKEK